MATLARALSHVVGTDNEIEALKMIAISCGAGLFVFLLFQTDGLDLSPGFF